MPLTRRLILQKARHHPTQKKGGAMTDYQHMVSGTLSLPSRGTFHHSLTVLIRYRSSGGIQAAEWSRQTHTGFHEPHATLGTHARNIHARFHLQGSHLLRPAIPDGSATQRHSRPAPAETRTHAPHNPAHATPAESHTHTVSPSSAIARHYTRNILSYGY